MLDIDLHSHSTYSDGQLTPRELVARAHGRGVQMYALTDHDELRGLTEARSEAEARGMKFVAGVEISVSWQCEALSETLHIVGLNIDPQHTEIADGLREVRAGRNVRAERIAADLERAGVDGALAGARRYARNPDLISRAHFARYMVERGIVKDTRARWQLPRHQRGAGRDARRRRLSRSSRLRRCALACAWRTRTSRRWV